MKPTRFTSPLAEHHEPEPAPVVPQGFLMLPACFVPAAVNQLYAWAFAQAQAAQEPPPARVLELFGNFN